MSWLDLIIMLTLRPYQKEALSSLDNLPNHPVLMEASVGSGKSLMIATYLMNHHGRCLCLTLSCELIEQNYKTYINQSGQDSTVFCAALNQKSMEGRVVFASPQSLVRSLDSTHFDVIIIDEAHAVNMDAKNSVYKRILNHYRGADVIGLTGTPHRGRNSIVGDVKFFKSCVYKIRAPELIAQGYLVRPVFEDSPSELSIPFGQLKLNSMNNFNYKQIEEVVTSSLTKTQRIMHILGQRVITQKRGGSFVFCATITQCKVASEVLEHYGQTKIISATTPNKERMDILHGAREGRVLFLVSVNCLLVGVDIPRYDTICFIRPTESLTLFLQAIGRGLRLSEGKVSCAVLDYAQNIDRFQDIDDPILIQALQRIGDDPNYCIPCYTCGTFNTPTARRCIGINENSRCSHYFNFKPCPFCQVENDITARSCRICEKEILDHNRKLKLLENDHLFPVLRTQYQITGEMFSVLYTIGTEENFNIVPEHYWFKSPKGKNIFYAQFVRKHVQSPSQYYPVLDRPDVLKRVAENAVSPTHLLLNLLTMKVKRKIFNVNQESTGT